MSTAVVMTGGGVKAAVTAARFAVDHELVLLHIDYGQRSSKAELEAIHALSTVYQSAHIIALDMPHAGQLQQQLASRGGDSARDFASGVIHADVLSESTVRGLFPVLLSTGLQCAARVGAAVLAVGVSRMADSSHVGWALGAGHPDYQREILHAFSIMAEAMLGHTATPRIEAPLLDVSYSEIFKLASNMKVPLDRTWSCERPGPRACGQCSRCKLRLEALVDAGLPEGALTGVAG